MIRSAKKKVVFFGCPLDCDERDASIQEKLSAESGGPVVDDPLKPIGAMLAETIPPDEWRMIESIPVPGWLRPVPPSEAFADTTVENHIRFLDQGGCRQYAQAVQDLVSTRVLPDFPCLVTVDHALSGGVYAALAEHYGPENLSLIVFDSHTDAVPMSKLAQAILYDAQTNPQSVHDRADPFLHNRPDSYNASSFIHCLLEEGVLEARDLYILGICDYPEKKARRINDPRIAEYVEIYSALQGRGATLVTRKECQMQPTKVHNQLKKIRTPYAYISIDMDIGARNAVEGVRFKNWKGLGEKQIFRLASLVRGIRGSDLELVGLDLAEINPRTAGGYSGTGMDRTYPIAADLIRNFAFELAA